jgi:hypothetical protein
MSPHSCLDDSNDVFRGLRLSAACIFTKCALTVCGETRVPQRVEQFETLTPLRIHADRLANSGNNEVALRLKNDVPPFVVPMPM